MYDTHKVERLKLTSCWGEMLTVLELRLKRIFSHGTVKTARSFTDDFFEFLSLEVAGKTSNTIQEILLVGRVIKQRLKHAALCWFSSRAHQWMSKVDKWMNSVSFIQSYRNAGTPSESKVLRCWSPYVEWSRICL